MSFTLNARLGLISDHYSDLIASGGAADLSADAADPNALLGRWLTRDLPESPDSVALLGCPPDVAARLEALGIEHKSVDIASSLDLVLLACESADLRDQLANAAATVAIQTLRPGGKVRIGVAVPFASNLGYARLINFIAAERGWLDLAPTRWQSAHPLIPKALLEVSPALLVRAAATWIGIDPGTPTGLTIDRFVFDSDILTPPLAHGIGVQEGVLAATFGLSPRRAGLVLMEFTKLAPEGTDHGHA